MCKASLLFITTKEHNVQTKLLQTTEVFLVKISSNRDVENVNVKIMLDYKSSHLSLVPWLVRANGILVQQNPKGSLILHSRSRGRAACLLIASQKFPSTSLLFNVRLCSNKHYFTILYVTHTSKHQLQ